jgi:hypothetical protein
LSFDRGAPAFWFVEIFLDGETLRHSNAGEAITFDGQTYLPLGDKLTPPRDIDRAANLKAQKFTLRYDSSLQIVDTDVVGKILDSNWKRRPIRVRYAIGDVGASGYDFSDPFIIADETGRVKDLEDTIEAGDAPLIEMEVESGALVFLERRNQLRTPANQRAAFPDDAFFDLAKRLDGVVLPWRTKRARNGSAQITYDIDEPAPREMLIGRGITRGSFVFGATVGPHRGWWIQVWALADHECEALEQCFVNGVDVLAGQSPLVHGVKRDLNFGGEPRLSLTWYDGRHDQTANAELITLTAAQPLKWTSAHRGRGVSYVITENRWDSDLPESYSYEFVLKGAKVYREQFDTTAGGSGSHRLNDPDSWTWTANPEEALRHYLRGRVVSPSSSYKWFGVDAPSSFIDPYAAYKYRADHCDEGVALKLGGTQPRYQANGWISAADSHAKNIQKLADCMVADPVDEGGRVSIRLGEPQTPVVELLDTDLMSDEETVAGVNARAEDVINRVEGRYRDPSNKYSQTDYPAVASEAFQEIDGAEIEGTFNQDLENSEERAQRKATLYLNKMRRTLELEEHFGPKAKDVRPGDWVTRKSALRGFPSGKTFIADEVRRFTDGTVRLLLLEVDPGEIAWNEADAQLTSIGAGPSTYDPPEILIPSVAVLAVAVTGGGTTYPGVRFTVTDYDDFVGDEIECEFGIWNGVSGGGMGIAGPSAILKIPGSLETFDAAANFLPGTTYAFRFRERAGERQGAWSDFQTETMTGDYIVGASAIADSIVGQGSGATANSLDDLNATDGANLTTSLSTSRRLIVSDFNADGRHWTTGFGGTPEAVADPTAEGYADVPNVGRVIRFNAFARYLTPKGVFTPVPGRRYAVIARVRVETAPSGGVINFALGSVNGLSTAYAHGDPGAVLGTIPGIPTNSSPTDTTWRLIGRTLQLATSPNTFNAFWRPRLDITRTGTGGRAEVVSMLILDVTDVPLGRLISGLLRDDGATAITEAAVITLLGTASAITGQGPGATAAAADVLNDALRTGSLFNVSLPQRPAIGADFTASVGSGTPASINALSAGTVVNVANEGDVRQFTDNNALSHRGWLPVVSSQTYRLRCRARVTVDGTNNQLFAQFASFNAAGTVIGAHGSIALEADFVSADGWIERELTITGATILATQPTAAFVRGRIYGGRNTGGTYSGATWQAAWLRLEDATEAIRLATVETGADVTAANEAASIAGQGALATLDTADYRTRISNLPPDTANLVLTQEFANGAGSWESAASTVVSVSGQEFTHALQLVSGGFGVQYENVWRPCRPGEKIYFQAMVNTQDAATGARLGVHVTDTAGANAQFLIVNVAGGLNWTLVTGLATAGANARRFRLFIFRSATAATSETPRMAQPFMARYTPGADPTAANQAASIAGQGALATRSNIVASLLNLGDPSNMVADSDLRDSAAWSLAAGWTFGSTDSDVTTGLGLVRAYKTIAGNGTTSQVVGFVSYPNNGLGVPVEPSRPLRLAAIVRAKAGFTGIVQIQARFGTAAGALISAPVVAQIDYRTTAAAADTNTLLSGVVLTPANAVYVQFRITVTWSTTQNNAGLAYIGAPFMQRAAQLGSLVTLQDGATIATDALLRTSLGTAAAVTGQGPGATAAAAAVLNENIATRGLLSARPASGVFTGQLYYATDTGQQFEWTSSAWALRADITAQSQLTIAATTQSVIINCNSAGVPAAGQLPRTVGLTLKLGNTVVSADAAWSIVSAGAATATVDDTATAAAGNLTVTALPSNADVIVSATYGGVTLRITVSFNRLLAPPPVSGSGGGTSASDTSIVDPASTSFTVVSDDLTVTTGSGGQVRLVANVDYNNFGGIGQRIIGRWQRNISGTWTDVGTEVSGKDSYRELDAESGSNFDFPGTLSIDQIITGLGASTSQSFRLRTRRSAGTRWSVYGSATATGS